MDKKYLLVSFEDERTKIIADILGNKTSGKIIDFLSEVKEASEKDISDKLSLPLNTVEYNLKKMIKAGLVEETKNFFWSPKGRKIKMYKFSNKSIVISPKSNKISSEIKQIIPMAFISGVTAVGIKFYLDSKNAILMAEEKTVALASEAATNTASQSANIINTGDYWMWFLGGAVFIIVMLMVRMILFEKTWANKGEK